MEVEEELFCYEQVIEGSVLKITENYYDSWNKAAMYYPTGKN
jgi:hypothetical protein